jgi:hypothetical protein
LNPQRDNWDGRPNRPRSKDESDEIAIVIKADATDKTHVGRLRALPPAIPIEDEAQQQEYKSTKIK